MYLWTFIDLYKTLVELWNAEKVNSTNSTSVFQPFFHYGHSGTRFLQFLPGGPGSEKTNQNKKGNFHVPLQVYHTGSEFLPCSCLMTWRGEASFDYSCITTNNPTCESFQGAPPSGGQWSESWCCLCLLRLQRSRAGRSLEDRAQLHLCQNISWMSQK